MHLRGIARLVAIVAGIGCTTAPAPVLHGIAEAGTARPAPMPRPAQCPMFPDECLALASARPRGCPAPATPAISFAPGSADIPRTELAKLDRVVRDSHGFADTARLVITAEASQLEPDDLARRRVDAVKDALVARGVVLRAGIVTVTSSVLVIDQLPEPPEDRVELGLRGCRS